MDYLLSANWRDQVVYGDQKPSPQILKDDGQMRVILSGLRAGQAIPLHPENKAIYHFLEGTGEMFVDDAVIPITPGATIFAPRTPGAACARIPSSPSSRSGCQNNRSKI